MSSKLTAKQRAAAGAIAAATEAASSAVSAAMSVEVSSSSSAAAASVSASVVVATTKTATGATTTTTTTVLRASKRKRGGEEDEEPAKGAEVEDDSNKKAHAMVQPTMERFSRRVVESGDAAAAREAKMNPYQLQWQEHGTLLYLTSKPGAPVPLVNSEKVAAFDMDNTLLRTSSGRKFPVGRNDWAWLLACIPAKLRALHNSGWKVVIFTNQNGISTGNQSAAEIKGKILDIIKDCGVPMSAFIASADDLYRKPATHGWQFMIEKCNGGIAVDLKQSIYVGDAAGRPAMWDGSAATKKDFSCSDRKFAFNVGMAFATPEEYFLNKAAAKFSWGGIDPTLFGGATAASAIGAAAAAPAAAAAAGHHHHIADPAAPHPSAAVAAAAAAAGGKVYPAAAAAASSSPVAAAASPASPASPAATTFHVATQELVLFVGLPASGKSTFARKHFVPHGYVHVNQDTLKTKEKCIKACAAALESGKSCVVDNTNPGSDVRALYIALARKAGCTVRCFHFITAEDVSKHLNMFREKLTGGAHKHVPRIAYNVFKKNFMVPTVKEGFKEIRMIDFSPYFDATPAGQKAKELFYQLS